VDNKQARLKIVLEKLYAGYNHRHLIKPDPLQFVYKYSTREDMEIAGFLAAALAYGRVRQIERSLTDLLGRMNDSPYNFILHFDNKKRKVLKSFKHRFTTGDDISDLLMLLKKVLRRYRSIENFFTQGYGKKDKNIVPALSKFCGSLLDMGKWHITKGLAYLLPQPESGSACKRLNLFLRWMVRRDSVDAGLWQSVDKARLIVPVDVHIGRLCRILGLYKQKTVSLSAAVKITESFSALAPADPVKYDFALSRIGIIENCTGRRRNKCKICELSELCEINR